MTFQVTRLASELAEEGVASLRFDLRAHGASEGRQEELTLSGVINDIRAAVTHMAGLTAADRVSSIGTSFGGGVCAFYASRYPGRLESLTLLNPLLNYKRRLIDEKPYWHNDQIDQTAGQELTANGYIPHSPARARASGARRRRPTRSDDVAKVIEVGGHWGWASPSLRPIGADWRCSSTAAADGA